MTLAIPGYRHVYLEGMEEASIFVHVAISDISGKVSSTHRTTGTTPAVTPRAMRPSGYLTGPVSPSVK